MRFVVRGGVRTLASAGSASAGGRPRIYLVSLHLCLSPPPRRYVCAPMLPTRASGNAEHALVLVRGRALQLVPIYVERLRSATDHAAW